jgi:hypothetical protein
MAASVVTGVIAIAPENPPKSFVVDSGHAAFAHMVCGSLSGRGCGGMGGADAGDAWAAGF